MVGLIRQDDSCSTSSIGVGKAKPELPDAEAAIRWVFRQILRVAAAKSICDPAVSSPFALGICAIGVMLRSNEHSAA
jgi:hypothetical protein